MTLLDDSHMGARPRTRGRRLLRTGLMLLPSSFLAVTASVGLQAVNKAAIDPNVLVACVGPAGYDSTGTWQMPQQDTVCAHANTHTAPNPNIPPGVGDVLSIAFLGANAASPNYVSGVSATGDFACGGGTLSGTGQVWESGSWAVDGVYSYSLSWTASFAHGIGSVTGTATDNNGVVHALGGRMAIADSTGGGCSDALSTQPDPAACVPPIDLAGICFSAAPQDIDNPGGPLMGMQLTIH
jgi:hypothetical protein